MSDRAQLDLVTAELERSSERMKEAIRDYQFWMDNVRYLMMSVGVEKSVMEGVPQTGDLVTRENRVRND